jgi:hypothetical protein
MQTRDVTCTACGAVNRIPAYSIRRIPVCGRCKTKLPEGAGIQIVRKVYKLPKGFYLILVAAVGIYLIWGPSTSPTTTTTPPPATAQQPPSTQKTAAVTAPVSAPYTPPVQYKAPEPPSCQGNYQPSEGVYRTYTNDADVAALTVRTASGSNYFLKLDDMYGSPIRSFYMYGGSTVTHNVPLGTFMLKYASGKYWCNEYDLFGPDTATSQADETFSFERKYTTGGYTISHWTVELVLQRGGNLRTRSIARDKF